MDDHDQQFCLRWNNHQSTIISVFGTLKENEALVDCTLAAEGKFLKAHKVVLSACSPYFATLLQEQYDKHPIFILKDVKYQELCAMMDYMYHGEVNISQDQLAALLKAAESLQIKGLSDNRSTGGSTVPKQEHHRASMPPTPKLSGGYTLEQTKRARIALGPGSIDNQEMGSREGSSSPSRRRRKMGRRSIENATTDVHDNANSSQQPPGPNAAVALSGVGAITAAASALAAGTIATSLPAGASLAGTSTSLAAPAVMSGAAISGTTTSTTKKTESLKAASQQSSDAMNTDNVQGSNLANIDAVSEHLHHHSTHHHHAGDIVDKSSNHKQQKQTSKDASGSGGGPSSELVIEPKSEYDDEGNDEAVEDLTLDEEDMAIDDLDQNAGTSQGGEGSSHGYAPWQPDRSQNELLLETQEAQQRDPQGFSNNTVSHFQHPSQFKHQPQRQRHQSTTISNHSTNTVTNNDTTITSSPCTTTTSNQDCIHNHTQQLSHTRHHHHHHHHHNLVAPLQPQQLSTSAHFDNFMLNEESFTCPQCFRTYRRHGTLRRHLRQECGKGKSMVCSVCGHRTKRADHLRQHVRKKHPEIALRSLFRRRSNNSNTVNTATTTIAAATTTTVNNANNNNRNSNSIIEQQEQQQLQQETVMVTAAAATLAALNYKPSATQSQQTPIITNHIVDLLDDDDDDDIDDDGDDDDENRSGEDKSTNLDKELARLQVELSDKRDSNVQSSSTAKFYQQQMHQQALKQLQQQLQHQQQQQERLAVAISSPATVTTIPIIDVEDNIKMNKINC
ncbi:longitudinals lacking isoform 5-T5 [Glossina fuscipes fuscipes]